MIELKNDAERGEFVRYLFGFASKCPGTTPEEARQLRRAVAPQLQESNVWFKDGKGRVDLFNFALGLTDTLPAENKDAAKTMREALKAHLDKFGLSVIRKPSVEQIFGRMATAPATPVQAKPAAKPAAKAAPVAAKPAVTAAPLAAKPTPKPAAKMAAPKSAPAKQKLNGLPPGLQKAAAGTKFKTTNVAFPATQKKGK